MDRQTDKRSVKEAARSFFDRQRIVIARHLERLGNLNVSCAVEILEKAHRGSRSVDDRKRPVSVGRNSGLRQNPSLEFVPARSFGNIDRIVIYIINIYFESCVGQIEDAFGKGNRNFVFEVNALESRSGAEGTGFDSDDRLGDDDIDQSASGKGIGADRRKRSGKRNPLQCGRIGKRRGTDLGQSKHRSRRHVGKRNAVVERRSPDGPKRGREIDRRQIHAIGKRIGSDGLQGIGQTDDARLDTAEHSAVNCNNGKLISVVVDRKRGSAAIEILIDAADRPPRLFGIEGIYNPLRTDFLRRPICPKRYVFNDRGREVEAADVFTHPVIPAEKRHSGNDGIVRGRLYGCAVIDRDLYRFVCGAVAVKRNGVAVDFEHSVNHHIAFDGNRIVNPDRNFAEFPALQSIALFLGQGIGLGIGELRTVFASSVFFLEIRIVTERQRICFDPIFCGNRRIGADIFQRSIPSRENITRADRGIGRRHIGAVTYVFDDFQDGAIPILKRYGVLLGFEHGVKRRISFDHGRCGIGRPADKQMPLFDRVFCGGGNPLRTPLDVFDLGKDNAFRTERHGKLLFDIGSVKLVISADFFFRKIEIVVLIPPIPVISDFVGD